MTMSLAKIYALEQANNLNKLTLTDFFKHVHEHFYPNQDISFMEYFLELTNHKDEFIVEHTKLIEFGVMTSNRSNDILSKLERFGLQKDKDYTLRDISQRGKSGVQIHKVYTLTPRAFKKCLMRARKYTGQLVDPSIYCDYYLLLEDIYELYTSYEKAYSEKLLSTKDDKIDKQSKK